MEEKILKHIGDRLLELNKPKKSRLDEVRKSSAIRELRLILEIFTNN